MLGPVSVQGCPGDALPFRLLVQLELSIAVPTPSCLLDPRGP